MIRSHRPRTVRTCTPRGVTAIWADPPDVLVTGAVFPDLDGAALAERVAGGRAPRPLLVLLTGRSAAVGWPGFDRVYVKPADPADLVRFVGDGGPSSESDPAAAGG